MVKGRQAAAFDIPQEFVEEVEETMATKNIKVVLERAKEVVEFEEQIQPPAPSSYTGRTSSNGQSRGNTSGKTFDKKENEVCMYNLPLHFTEDDIKSLLAKSNIGFKRYIRVLKDNYTQKSRGIAFFECQDKVIMRFRTPTNDV